MQAHQKRVINERDSLNENLGKLKGFMHSEIFSALSSVEQGLLMVQPVAMDNYFNALERRIELF